MWEIDNITQIQSFFYAVLLGFLYCVLYDLIRAFRLEGNNSAFAVVLQDMFYWAICSVSCFCFLLAVTNGELRTYIFIGIFTGFVILRLTFSKLYFPVFKLFAKLFSWAYDKFNGINNTIFNGFDRLFNYLLKKFAEFSNVIRKCLKKLLKKARVLLYTNQYAETDDI